MATDYLKDWTKKVDTKNGGFHLAHNSGKHTISFLPNKEKGGYDIKHSGKLVGHHPNAAGALKHAASYFKQNYNKQAPATVNFPSQAAKKPINKAETIPPKANYFKNKLSEIKGVHKPYMSEGTSFAGEMNREAVAQNSPVHADMARKLHEQKLKEILGIKPNLPKAELEKARVDEGKSPAQKVQSREGRNMRYFKDLKTKSITGMPKHNEKGVHASYGKGTGESVTGTALKVGDKHIAQRDHAKVIADQKSMPKPNLPKSELEKGEFKKEITKDGYKLHHKNGHIHASKTHHFMDEIADGKSPNKQVTKYKVVPKGSEDLDNNTDIYDSLEHAKSALTKKSELTKADKDEYKLIGSHGTKEGLEEQAKKHFYSDSIHFKPEADGTHSVHNAKGKIEGLRVKSSKNRHRLERKIEKSELAKAKVDEGKPVATKISDRQGRYFRDRLMNIKGTYASAQTKPKPSMEFEVPAATKESVKSNAQLTHNKTMAHLKETKPNLPK